MTNGVTFEQVEALAAQLPREDRLRLAEKILTDLRTSPPSGEPGGFDWMAVRGIAPNLLGGEDAQQWVSRTRREADEHREKQWRRGGETG